MTDDFLADFERELHAAARRRRAVTPRRLPRLVRPAMALAFAVAAVAVVVSLAGAPEREVEVPAGPPPAGTQVQLQPLEATACQTARERTVDAGDLRMGIFRRPQHAPDAPYDGVDLAALPAADYDGRAMRSPGLEGTVLLSPTSETRPDCARGSGEPGVCVVVDRRNRCFPLADIVAGRAIVLLEPGVVMGLEPDGVEAVTVEAGGRRVRAAVVENAFRAELPGAAAGTPVRVTLQEAGSACAPPERLRVLVPALDYEPPAGGVPRAVRGSFGGDSAVIGRHARLWGGGDGVSYWVVPRLRCDGAGQDAVCVFPLFDEDADEHSGGGSACETANELEGTPGWIHFPLRTGGSAVAGLAPPGATHANARLPEENFEQRFRVKDGVWGGTLTGHELRGEVGAMEVTYEIPPSGAPAVAVLNGTTTPGLAAAVMDALVHVNYRRARPPVVDWPERAARTVVHHVEGSERLGRRIALYLRERYDTPPIEVREMTDEVRRLAGEEPGAVVIAGADLADG